MRAAAIARVCHEANRAYCKTIGDDSQLPWEEAPDWQKASAISGVEFHLAHPRATPADSHHEWMREKARDGWVYGPEKDPEKKEHPCMVNYLALPIEQRVKDHLFISIVRALGNISEYE